MSLEVGSQYVREFEVQAVHTVPAILPGEEAFASMPVVFTTGCLLAVMELACIEQLAPTLDEEQISLGIEMALTHTAPCTPGTKLTITATVTDVSPKVVSWDVSVVSTEGGVLMGEGKHKRAIVNRERFCKAASEQAERIGGHAVT